jgi:hypothetical protein
MTTKPKPQRPVIALARPRAFVARLILADLIAKRGEGPLERKRVAYAPRKP